MILLLQNLARMVKKLCYFDKYLSTRYFTFTCALSTHLFCITSIASSLVKGTVFVTQYKNKEKEHARLTNGTLNLKNDVEDI